MPYIKIIMSRNAELKKMATLNVMIILFQVDGYIARNFKGQSSHLGSVLDPLADKFLISILYVTLTVNGIIPGRVETL